MLYIFVLLFAENFQDGAFFERHLCSFYDGHILILFPFYRILRTGRRNSGPTTQLYIDNKGNWTLVYFVRVYKMYGII